MSAVSISRTWGVAFELDGTLEEQQATLSYLEWREKQYDVRHRVDVYGKDGELAVAGALTYIASPASDNYLGPAPLSDIAAQIATAAGPSGPNYQYLFKLADAMRVLGVHDDHELYELEGLVRQLMAGSVAATPAVNSASSAAVAGLGAAATSGLGAHAVCCSAEDGAEGPSGMTAEEEQPEKPGHRGVVRMQAVCAGAGAP